MREGWVSEGPAEEIEDIIYEVKRLPIANILTRYGVDFQRQTGNRALSLCPFHMDNRIGSFSVNMSKNTCWCYACNQGGNTIKAVSVMTKMPYTQAALQIACDEGLIDASKFEQLSSVKYEAKTSTSEGFVQKEDEDPTRVSHKVLLRHRVYEAFKAASDLSQEHRDNLVNVRSLSNDRIEADYFTISSYTYSTVDKMKELLNYQYDDEEIATVPGFYLEKTHKGTWHLSYFAFKGIGILLRDANGYAKAVQIRLDEASGSRYIYMSGRQTGCDLFKGGASVDTVIDYLPCTKESHKLAITEGRFKAEVLRQNGYNTLSVQGVNNYMGMVPIIKALEYKRIDIFYDADMIKNPQVCAACNKLIRYLKNGLSKVTISVIIWDYNKGKGIDDLIFAGNKADCVRIIGNEFITAVDHTLEDAIVEAGFDKDAPANQFTKADRDIILSMFETLMRKRLNM